MRREPTESGAATRQRDPQLVLHEARVARRYDAIGGLAVLFALLGAALGLHDSAAPAPRPMPRSVEPTPAHVASTTGSEMASSLQGTVRDSEGQPIAEATICASPVDDAARVKPNHCVVADGYGAYFFAGLAPAAYVVTAAAHGYDPGVAQAGRPLKLTGYGSMIGVDVVLHPGEIADGARGEMSRPARASQGASQLVAPVSARGTASRRRAERGRAGDLQSIGPLFDPSP